MQTELLAIRTGGSNEEVGLKADRHGDLRVVQYLPPYAMLCAQGKLFAFDSHAATERAPVTSFPEHQPEWCIYNGNVSGGPHVVLMHIAAVSESGTTGLGLCIAALTAIGEQTAFVENESGTVCTCLDGTAKKPNVYLGNNPTILGTQAAYVVLDARDTVAATMVGAGVVAKKVDGKLIAPPKGGIYIAIVGPLGGSAVKYDLHFVIAEIQLDT